MKYLPILITLFLLTTTASLTAHAAAPPKPNLYLLGIAIDQVGLTGNWIQIGKSGDWKDTNAAVILDGQLYTTETTGGLWNTNPNTGAYRQIGKSEFANTKFFFADTKFLYSIEKDGTLYRITPQDGSWSQLGKPGDWKATQLGLVFDGNLYTIETSGILYATNLQTGQYKKLGSPDFADTKLLVAANKSLYAIDSTGALSRINPADGSQSPLSNSHNWKLATTAAVLDNQLYTTESDGHLVVTNLQTAARKTIGNPEFANTRFIFPVAGKLITIETSGNLYYVSAGKDQTVDSFNWCPEEFEKAFHDQGAPFYNQLHSNMLLGSKVTHPAVMAALKSLQQSTSPNDLVLLFIDAHGSTDPKEGWGIWTADNQTLWGREIKIELAKLNCNAIVIDETCESGGFAQSHPNDPPVPPNVTAICACQAAQVAYNQLDLAVGEALYGRADFNHDNTVTISELIRYTKERYKEFSADPNAGQGNDTPVIVKSKSLPDDFPLTKSSPNLSAILVDGNYWSALLEKDTGEHYHVHVIGWSNHPGEPYFQTNSATRDFITLPTDGPPILAEQKGQWLPARLISQKGSQSKVHILGQNRDLDLPSSQIKYPFAGNPN